MLKHSIKILVLAFLLCPFQSGLDARHVIQKFSGGCLDCSGTAVFLWECNDPTVGDPAYSPCGCVASGWDDEANANGQATITSGECVFNDTGSNGADYYDFDIPDGEYWDEGTCFVKFIFVTSLVDNVNIFSAVADSNDYFECFVQVPANDIECYRYENGTFDSVALDDGDLTADAYFHVRYRWKLSGNPDHQITLYNAAYEEQDDVGHDDDLVGFTDPFDSAGDSDLHIGNDYTAAGSHLKIDYAHCYNTWLDTDPNAP